MIKILHYQAIQHGFSLALWILLASHRTPHMTDCFLHKSINCQPHYQHLLAAVSEPVNRLISTCQQLHQHLSSAWLAPVSHWISNCQPLVMHLSAAWSALDHFPLRRLKSTEWAARIASFSQLICAYWAPQSVPTQPPDQCLSAAWQVPVSLLIST